MQSRLIDPEQWVSEFYNDVSDTDADFGDIVRRVGDVEPGELADVIEADGFLRMKSGRPVELSRYLEGVSDLVRLEVALDAAIEVCCRAAAMNGDKDPAAHLIRQYPEFEPHIRRSELLAQLFSQSSGTPAAPPSRTLPCEIGPVLNGERRRYDMRELLGFGSQGGVYLAVDRQLSEPQHPAWVAIKVLRGRASESGDGEVWRTEASHLRRVSHTNVVRVLDRGIAPWGEGFIVYDYVRGGTLRAWIESKSGRPGPRQAAALVRDLARGIQAVHSAGLVHCDLKPDNVIMDEDGVPRIADFGVAAPSHSHGRQATQRFGSPAFMSPEQFREDPGWLLPGSDIYSLGGILFWLLTGMFPNGRSFADIVRNLQTGGRAAAPAPRLLCRNVDADLDAICRRAMAPSSADRYASAEMLASDLEAYLDNRPIPWRLYSGLGSLKLLCRRCPLLVGAYLGAVMLLMVVACFMYLRQAAMVSKTQHAAALRIAALDARVAVDDAREQARRKALEHMLKSMERMSAAGLGTEWLSVLNAMEAMTGSFLLGDPTDPASLWSKRIQITEDLVRTAEEQGRGQSLEPLMWQSALTIWLVRADRPEDAMAVLEKNREAWSKKLGADDRWLARLDLVRACAEAAAAVKSFREDKAAERRARSSLQELSRTLNDQVVDDRDPASRLGRAVLRKGRDAGLISGEF
jgi:hypothetical protein